MRDDVGFDAASIRLTPAIQWVGALVALVPLSGGVFGMFQVWKLFGDCAQGHIFTSQASTRLRRLAWSLIVSCRAGCCCCWASHVSWSRRRERRVHLTRRPIMPIVVNLDVMLAKRKMRSRELAEHIGITEQNISLLKSGKVRGVRFDTLSHICEVLQCQLGDLLEYKPDDKSSQAPAQR